MDRLPAAEQISGRGVAAAVVVHINEVHRPAPGMLNLNRLSHPKAAGI